MPDKTLLIPGTGGCKLLKDNKSIGHPGVLNARIWLINTVGGSLAEIEKLLSMEHEPGQPEPRRTCLIDGKEIEPGDVLTVAYNQALSWVNDVFLYDWRGDLEYSANRLLRFLKKNRPAGGRWKIVTHSQGGLVAIVASKLYAARHGGEPNEFANLVSHLCMVAAPVYGTLNSAHALIVGDRLGKDAKDVFREIAGTWPALYQMLPDWYALRTPTGDFSKHGFFDPATWREYSWIKSHLLARALSIRKSYLREPVTHLSGVKYSFVLSSNRDTWNHAVIEDSGKITFPKRNRAGDTLVPLKITQARMSSVARNRCHVIGPEEPIAVHSMMLSDDFVASIARQEFSQ